MADTKYFALVTDSGTKEMLEAVNEERKVNITHFAVGDGGGQYYVPDVTMTELKNEVWRGEVGSCRISEESENVMIVETVIPSDEGGFTIREMAVFDENGTMIAVCNTPDTAKVKITDGVVHELRLQMEILLNNKESAQILVDPNVVTATKKDLEIAKKEIMLYLSGIICSYSYCAEIETISCIVPHGYADETIEIPNGMAYMDGETVVLASGIGEFGNTQAGSIGEPYVLPIADADTLGGVKIGSGIKRLPDGTISIDTSNVAESVSEQVATSVAEKAAEIVESNATEPSDEDIDGLFH